MPLSRKMSRALLVLALIVFWVALFISTHVPTHRRTGPPPQTHWDKVAHAAAFAGLAMLLSAAASTMRAPTVPVYLAILGLLALYAFIDEFTQGLIPSRAADPRDFVADIAGALAGIVAFAWIWSVRERVTKKPIAVTATD